ncbi:MAG: diguanylate cyclase [Gammaproteobacteria bacterium]|nr:diguanylate cyclase [Gammaproteobacteria bacterium]
MGYKNQILVVDDSASLCDLISIQMQAISDIEIAFASSYAEAEDLLLQGIDYLCAVLDLNLPDAPNGEIIDLVQQYNIPSIILTGSIKSAIKNTVNSEFVIDYIVKRNPSDIKYLASTIKNIYNNQFVKVLAVDDSVSFCEYLVKLLGNLRYHIFTASNGEEALAVMNEHPDISLVITDYFMPKMDGLSLISEIRKYRKREEIAILGLSVQNDNELIVNLLKVGANDYMTKPFIVNEFYCRVLQNTNMIGFVRNINECATRDFLTSVYNRQSLFDMGELMYANAKRDSIDIAVAMIDADNFKSINDEYGHDAGDQVLVKISKTLKSQLRTSDIVARFGGEEFVCVTVIKNDDALTVFDRIRMAIEKIQIEVEGKVLEVSVSIGVTKDLSSSFNDMIKIADKGMFQAKEAGRNRVIEI